MNELLEYDLTPYIQLIYDSITFESGIKFMIVYFFIIWIALLVWVLKDIKNRTSNWFIQLISILIILVGTPLGIFIYLLIRPGKTLFEKYHSEVENNLDAMEEMIEEKNKDYGESLHCFCCDIPLLPAFKYCPKCKIELKKDCSGCKKELYRNWEICPFCGEGQKEVTHVKKPIIVPKIQKSEKVHDEILEIVNHLKEPEEKIKSTD
ncbi:hypothetical protein N8455_00325 [Candidatus Gracilibacteria bacterium]|nr:hypothetical protein [Candidatus Gracilibacteria bacterium]